MGVKLSVKTKNFDQDVLHLTGQSYLTLLITSVASYICHKANATVFGLTGHYCSSLCCFMQPIAALTINCRRATLYLVMQRSTWNHMPVKCKTYSVLIIHDFKVVEAEPA